MNQAIVPDPSALAVPGFPTESADPAPQISGSGLRLTLSSGIELLDAVSGTFNLPLGYNHAGVVAAVASQLGRVAHVSSLLAAPEAEKVRKRLLSVAPPEMGAVWLRDITGSTAVEGAIKIAQKHTGKTDVISLFHSHHGQTIFTTGISGNAFRRETVPATSVTNSIKVPAPYCHRCFFGAVHPHCGLRCATSIQDFIEYASSGRVAALILEPVQGNGGNIVPPDGYFDEIRRVCDRNGILLIVDEVQTGIGRTGEMFACQTFDIKPDLIVVAKGLGGIGIPVAAVLMRPEYNVLESFEHSFTSGANLLALAAASATLDAVGSDGFLQSVRERAVQLADGLRSIASRTPLVCDVRGVGLMWGMEIVEASGKPSPELTNRLVNIALGNHRLIVRGSRYGRGNTLKIRPALIATEADIDEILKRLASSFSDLERYVGRA